MTAKEYMKKYNGQPALLIDDKRPCFSHVRVLKVESAGDGLVTVVTKLHRLFRCDDAEIQLIEKRGES